MSDKAYNLLDEQFIRCCCNDGGVKMHSLKSIFEDSHSVIEIICKNEWERISLLRLMQSVLYCSSLFLTLKDCKTLWKQTKFNDQDVKKIHNYLESCREKFYLIHPKYPFLQTSEDMDEKTISHIYCLGYEGESSMPFFNHTTNNSGPIDAIDTVVQLISMQFIVPAGGRGYITSELSGKNIYLIGGNNLFEIISLNTIPYKTFAASFGEDTVDLSDDLPSWESEEKSIAKKIGPINYMTTTHRKIKLIPDGGDTLKFKKMYFSAKNRTEIGYKQYEDTIIEPLFCYSRKLVTDKKVDKKISKWIPFNVDKNKYRKQLSWINCHSLINYKNQDIKCPKNIKHATELLKNSCSFSYPIEVSISGVKSASIRYIYRSKLPIELTSNFSLEDNMEIFSDEIRCLCDEFIKEEKSLKKVINDNFDFVQGKKKEKNDKKSSNSTVTEKYLFSYWSNVSQKFKNIMVKDIEKSILLKKITECREKNIKICHGISDRILKSIRKDVGKRYLENWVKASNSLKKKRNYKKGVVKNERNKTKK